MIAEGALRIGQSVAKQVALRWFADKKADARRGRDLAKLVRARFPVVRKEREILDSLRTIEDDVARGLEPDLARASYGLPDNERDAALMAVSDALEDADLSDSVLFGADLDAKSLAAEVRRQQPVDRAGLSERAVRLYDAALERACVVLVHLVGELPEFDAAVAVESLRRLSSALEGIDALLERVPVPDLSAPTGRRLDDEFRARYLDLVARSYDRLDVIGLTTHSYEPRTTLSVAYLSLTVTGETVRKRYDVEDFDWRNIDRRPSDNLRVEVALGDSTLTVVRGEAGAGKSTLLRWLAVNAARSSFSGQLGEWNDCVPFLVKLRDFAGAALPRGDELLHQPSSPQFGPVPEGWVHRQFESGRALLLVDGVDELTARRRPDVRKWLRGLLESYPSVRVVMTSRPTAVSAQWLVNEGFRSVVLEPMTPGDVQVFLQRWHSALLDSATDPRMLPCKPEQVDEHCRTLMTQLQARADLRALARSPLLCAMLCALNLDRRSKLPRDRAALYRSALEMLLERRDADRNVAAGSDMQATLEEKQELLQVLAWWLNQNRRTEMSREQALARMSDRLRGMSFVGNDAEPLLVHLTERSGVIRVPVQGRVDFIHRTFQEYLAACEALAQDSVDLLIQNASSDMWRETVIMACALGNYEQRKHLLDGILDAADRMPGKKARRFNLLAAACRETATYTAPEALARVDERIRTLLPPRSVRESRSLATVGESMLEHLPSDLSGLSAAQAAACVRTAALVNGLNSLELLTKYASDHRTEVIDQLISAWTFFDRETYARRVLADVPLTDIEVDHQTVPYLHLLRDLRSCHLLLAGDQPGVDLSPLSGLEQLRALFWAGGTAPHDLSDVSRLTQLNELHMSFGTGWSSELGFIDTLYALRFLTLRGCTTTDYGFLRQLRELQSIRIWPAPVAAWMGEVAQPLRIRLIGCADLLQVPEVQAEFARRFRELSLLEIVNSSDNPKRGDVGGIAELPIRYLILSGPMVVDVSSLRGKEMEVHLHGTTVVGADDLGPGVKIVEN